MTDRECLEAIAQMFELGYARLLQGNDAFLEYVIDTRKSDLEKTREDLAGELRDHEHMIKDLNCEIMKLEKANKYIVEENVKLKAIINQQNNPLHMPTIQDISPLKHSDYELSNKTGKMSKEGKE
jgi:predicted nuclease with TOPRIM domain